MVRGQSLSFRFFTVGDLAAVRRNTTVIEVGVTADSGIDNMEGNYTPLDDVFGTNTSARFDVVR